MVAQFHEVIRGRCGGRGSLSSFHLYEASNRGLALLVDGSDAAAARANLRTYQAFSTELILAPGQEKLLLVDFLSENSTYMPIRIQTSGSFFTDRRANFAMLSGVVIGIAVLVFRPARRIPGKGGV